MPTYIVCVGCLGLSAALIISSFFIEVQQIIDFVILSLLTPEFIHLQSYVSLLVMTLNARVHTITELCVTFGYS